MKHRRNAMRLKRSAENDLGVKIEKKNQHKNHAFQILFLSASGLRRGGVWRLQLPDRTAGVNARELFKSHVSASLP